MLPYTPVRTNQASNRRIIVREVITLLLSWSFYTINSRTFSNYLHDITENVIHPNAAMDLSVQ